MANMELEMNVEQQMEQRPSATLIMFASLLALSSVELEQTMRTELIDNPALELVEVDICPRCGNACNEGVCYFCLDQESPRSNESSGSIHDDEFDLFSIVVAPRTLAEELTELAHTAIPKEDHFIAEFLIGGLND